MNPSIAANPPMDPVSPLIAAAADHAAALLDQADALIVAAGAGMGVDSGLPDFRGNEGFWRAYPALAQAQLDFASVASPAAFRAMPELAWGFYGHRLALYRRTVPHVGFAQLLRWGARMHHGLSVFTSNVDGQFQIAGYPPDAVHECHGSIHHLQCLHGCSDAIWRADEILPDVDEATCRLRNAPPRCPHCGALARPNILMFNDWDWVEARTAAQSARQHRWLQSVKRPVVVELGAGTAIPSVRHFSQRILHHHGGRLIRINPREWEVPTRSDVGLPMRAAQGLALVEQALSGAL